MQLSLTAKAARCRSGLFVPVFYAYFAHGVQYSRKKRVFFYAYFAQQKMSTSAYSTRFEGIFSGKILFNIYNTHMLKINFFKLASHKKLVILFFLQKSFLKKNNHLRRQRTTWKILTVQIIKWPVAVAIFWKNFFCVYVPRAVICVVLKSYHARGCEYIFLSLLIVI